MICLDSWTASFIVISVALEAGFFQRQAQGRLDGWWARRQACFKVIGGSGFFLVVDWAGSGGARGSEEKGDWEGGEREESVLRFCLN
jgi:hypothetical protein